MGFNTEIEYQGVVYHVQTEPRKEASIETTVYRQGAVIHKYTSSYQELLDSPGFSEDEVKLMLKDQHRQVIARIRAGEITTPWPPP